MATSMHQCCNHAKQTVHTSITLSLARHNKYVHVAPATNQENSRFRNSGSVYRRFGVSPRFTTRVINAWQTRPGRGWGWGCKSYRIYHFQENIAVVTKQQSCSFLKLNYSKIINTQCTHVYVWVNPKLYVLHIVSTDIHL